MGGRGGHGRLRDGRPGPVQVQVPGRPAAHQGEVPAARPDQGEHVLLDAGGLRGVLDGLRRLVRAGVRAVDLHPRDGPRGGLVAIRRPRHRAAVHPRPRGGDPPPAVVHQPEGGRPRRPGRADLGLRGRPGLRRGLCRHGLSAVGRPGPGRSLDQPLQPHADLAARRLSGVPQPDPLAAMAGGHGGRHGLGLHRGRDADPGDGGSRTGKSSRTARPGS